MRSRTIAVAVLLVLAMPVAAQAENGLKKFTDALSKLAKPASGPRGNLVVNGGFEEPVVRKGGYITVNSGQAFTGWQVVGTGSVSPISGDYTLSGIRFPAHAGAQWLDLTGPGTNAAAGVQQTVATEPGKSYELAFWVGNVAGGSFGTTSSVEILVDGRSLGVALNDRSIPGQLGWGLFKMPVTATGNTTTLTFINRDARNDNSNGLDDVSLVPAAAGPATAATAPVLTESFEMPATGNYTTYRAGQSFTTGSNTWTVQTGSIDIANIQVRREVVAADGIQTVDLAGSPGAGVIATTFPTTAGQAYSLTFQYARNNGIGNTPARAKVEVVGAATLLQAEIRHEAASQPASANQPFNGSFVADGAMTTLRFTSLNDGNTGITVDGISVSPVSPAPNLSGEYVYQGSGVATVSQVGDEVRIFFTWTPQGVGPHYEAKGKLAGDTIKGEWYSLYAQKGWFKLVGKVAPNGDIDFAKSDDPINANFRKTVLTRKK
ncbi:MAG: DUF642 domain-containing protein [Chromatiales bacterium]|jgi:hypothetical protein|nr:MAG: DUF642 domain-containing protein [Chromatiales bacterium]